jgi:hypothetical protein
MNIELDSWEAGYADGLYARRSQCAVGLDQVSYLSGYCQGRAWRAESRTKAPRVRSRARSLHEVPQHPQVIRAAFGSHGEM